MCHYEDNQKEEKTTLVLEGFLAVSLKKTTTTKTAVLVISLKTKPGVSGTAGLRALGRQPWTRPPQQLGDSVGSAACHR